MQLLTKYTIIILLIFTNYYYGLAQQDTLKLISSEETEQTSPSKKIQFTAKPKSMWELGIHTGHFLLEGDVDPLQPAGYGVGVHLRKSILYGFSLRADFIYGQTRGLDPQFTPKEIAAVDLNETSAGGKHDGIYRNYQLKDYIFSLQAIVNVGNLLFHTESSKWNLYAVLGIGADMNTTKMDVLHGNSPYDFSEVTGNVNTKAGRKSIKKQVKSMLDGKYETEARQKVAIFRLGDTKNIHALLTTGVGISRKLSNRINIGIEHQLIKSDNDLLDGFVYRSIYDQSNSSDISHYTSIRLGINVGNFNRRVEPMYWLNPLDGYLNEITDLKSHPIMDISDADGDGVAGMLDQEKNTPPGMEVDAKGISVNRGRNRSVVIKRELIKDKTTAPYDDNTKTENKIWKITIKNNKSELVQFVLMDQVPVSSLAAFGTSSIQLSGGQLDEKTGEVKWNLVLEPSAKKEIVLQYQVKYGKGRS